MLEVTLRARSIVRRHAPGKMGRKARALFNADRLRDSLPLCLSHRPNPCELNQEIEPDHTDKHRLLGCPSYDRCLAVACLADWNSMTCRACDVFATYAAPLQKIERKVKQNGHDYSRLAECQLLSLLNAELRASDAAGTAQATSAATALVLATYQVRARGRTTGAK